jgi:hypothetical protein
VVAARGVSVPVVVAAPSTQVPTRSCSVISTPATARL